MRLLFFHIAYDQIGFNEIKQALPAVEVRFSPDAHQTLCEGSEASAFSIRMKSDFPEYMNSTGVTAVFKILFQG